MTEESCIGNPWTRKETRRLAAMAAVRAAAQYADPRAWAEPSESLAALRENLARLMEGDFSEWEGTGCMEGRVRLWRDGEAHRGS